MFESRIPVVPEEQKFMGPLQFPTLLLLNQLTERLQAQGYEQPPAQVEFELASRTGLASALRRHTPGKPVTGAGCSPIVDWVICSAAYRGDARHVLEYAPGFLQMSDPETFITDLLSPLTLWVLDLPASESHHHSYRYGLIDHMLEVALASMVECIPSLEDLLGKGLLPLHLYDHATRLPGLLGLVHDIGKVFNVEVKEPKTGETWDPMREPLAYFKARHEIPILEPTDFRFLPGRGMNSHEKKGRDLLPLVFHPRIWRHMRSAISKLYDAYLGRYGPPTQARPIPLDFIADCVHRADGMSAARSHARGSKPGDYLLELAADKALET